MISPDATLAQSARAHAIQISIDGPAGSGKTTIGRALAAAIRCPYLDTGMMYRAVTWIALRRGVSLDDSERLAAIARSTAFSLAGPGESLEIDGSPPPAELRSSAVDAAVSQVSAHAAVREALVVRQREMASGGCIVMVGRDIGTVVLPDADLKLWIVASPVERARRRLAEHLPGGSHLTLAEAERQIMERDAQDTGRAVSPLRRPQDAAEIDTGRLSPSECVQRALELLRLASQREGRAHG